jgi:hypothetical protein
MYWLHSIISLIIAAGFALTPQIYNYVKTGHFTISNMAYIGNIGHALELAKPEDVAIMPDRESRQFLGKALEKKKERDLKIKAIYPEETHWLYICSSNAYNVAIPVASKLFQKPNVRLAKIANILIKKHFIRKMVISFRAFMYSTSHNVSRLSMRIPGGFWLVSIV